MNRLQGFGLAVLALAGVAGMGALAVSIQRSRDEVSGRNAYRAMRAEEALRLQRTAADNGHGGSSTEIEEEDEDPPAPATITHLPAAPAADPARRFVELKAADLGVGFVHDFGGGHMDNLVKASGGGVAVFDYDGDGDEDLYFPQGGALPFAAPAERSASRSRNALFRNDGGWKFTDVTEACGLGDEGYGLGAAVADYDGDGDLDVFVTNFGQDRLYRNEGGRFIDVTTAAGLTGGCTFSVGAAWGDVDGDGHLDLWVCGYVDFDPAVKAASPSEMFAGPLAFRGETNRLYLGAADGTFRDATRASGLWSTDGRGMGVAIVDVSAEGKPPVLLVANDAVANFAFERRENGVYTESAFLLGFALSGLGQRRASMGIAVLDADRDGLPDLVVPDATGGAFYRNLGPRFEERAVASGIGGAMERRTGWSAVPLDYDLDGFPDLYFTCGALHAQEPQRPSLFRNLGQGRFEEVSRRVLPERMYVGRGCAASDLDGDGDLDLVAVNLGARPVFFRNDGDGGSSLTVTLKGKSRNTGGIGARVDVEVVEGGLVQSELLTPTQGYLSGTGPRLVFGLHGAASVHRVRVRFPGGAVAERKDVPAGRVIIEEP